MFARSLPRVRLFCARMRLLTGRLHAAQLRPWSDVITMREVAGWHTVPVLFSAHARKESANGQLVIPELIVVLHPISVKLTLDTINKLVRLQPGLLLPPPVFACADGSCLCSAGGLLQRQERQGAAAR
jgi:hypothetical protein